MRTAYDEQNYYKSFDFSLSKSDCHARFYLELSGVSIFPTLVLSLAYFEVGSIFLQVPLGQKAKFGRPGRFSNMINANVGDFAS